MDRLSFRKEKLKEDLLRIDEIINTGMKGTAKSQSETAEAKKIAATAQLYRGTIKMFYVFFMMRFDSGERNKFNLARVLGTVVRLERSGVCTAKFLLGNKEFNNPDISAYLKEGGIDQNSINEVMKARDKADEGWSAEEYRKFEKFLKRKVQLSGKDFEKNIIRGGLVVGSVKRETDNILRYGSRKNRGDEKNKRPDPEFVEECRGFLQDHTPRSIKRELDKYIIGQDDAKKLISLAVYNHYQRICHPEEKLKKCNVLMVGPSGCGKTEIVRRLKDMLNVPVVLADFSGIVSTPYTTREGTRRKN